MSPRDSFGPGGASFQSFWVTEEPSQISSVKAQGHTGLERAGYVAGGLGWATSVGPQKHFCTCCFGGGQGESPPSLVQRRPWAETRHAQPSSWHGGYSVFGIQGTSWIGHRARARPKSFVSEPRGPLTILHPLPPLLRALCLDRTEMPHLGLC